MSRHQVLGWRGWLAPLAAIALVGCQAPGVSYDGPIHPITIEAPLRYRPATFSVENQEQTILPGSLYESTTRLSGRVEENRGNLSWTFIVDEMSVSGHEGAERINKSERFGADYFLFRYETTPRGVPLRFTVEPGPKILQDASAMKDFERAKAWVQNIPANIATSYVNRPPRVGEPIFEDLDPEAVLRAMASGKLPPNFQISGSTSNAVLGQTYHRGRLCIVVRVGMRFAFGDDRRLSGQEVDLGGFMLIDVLTGQIVRKEIAGTAAHFLHGRLHSSGQVFQTSTMVLND